MNIQISSIVDDLVIDSKFITGKTDFRFAIEYLYPIINRLPIQRNLQNPSFYHRLRLDLIRGCVMPPITLAFISEKEILPTENSAAEEFINTNIDEAFILDGIQRINALYQTYSSPDKDLQKTLDLDRPLYVNILICKKMDNLLYRMVTLNNGQKPMSANHQIEILLGNIFKFDSLNIIIKTEKERGRKGKYEHSFDKANIIKAYLAFLADSTAIDNKKIIESKLDELIAKKIIDSNITEETVEFSSVIELINRMCESNELKKWFDNTNNIIGFCVGIKKSFDDVDKTSTDDFEKSISQFELAFRDLNLSTIKLSRERRSLTEYYIKNYSELGRLEEMTLLDRFSEEAL